jgi:cysteine desulfurase
VSATFNRTGGACRLAIEKRRRYPPAMLYFDHNATTPVLPEARAAWLEAVETFIGNPSSPHRLGQRAEAALQAAREQLAAFLGCDALDVVWTSGATESNNMVLHHFARAAGLAERRSPNRRVLARGSAKDRAASEFGAPDGAEAWVSAIEHPCVLAAADTGLPRRARRVPAGRDGVVELDWLRDGLRKRKPALVAVMAANNETGVLQPWREVLAMCRENGVPFLCDAAQWVGKLPARGLGVCDFVSGCAHKFGGPKGVGFLKCPSGARLTPLLVGGKQEDGRRAGTENVAGVLSMMAALEARERLLAAGEQKPRLAWREAFERGLREQLPGSEIVGAGVERLWNTVSALMPEADCQQRWVVKLDKFGCAVSTGSACASGREEPSHVLAAMGRTPKEAGRVLRFSSGWETTEEDWAALLAALGRVRVEVNPRGKARSSKFKAQKKLQS